MAPSSVLCSRSSSGPRNVAAKRGLRLACGSSRPLRVGTCPFGAEPTPLCGCSDDPGRQRLTKSCADRRAGWYEREVPLSRSPSGGILRQATGQPEGSRVRKALSFQTSNAAIVATGGAANEEARLRSPHWYVAPF